MYFSSFRYFKTILFLILLLLHQVIKSQIEKEPEFYEDSSSYDVTFYWLNLNLSDNSKYISGNTSIVAKATNTNLSRFYIELSDTLSVDSIMINNINQSFYHKNGWIKTVLNNAIDKDKYFTAKIFYHGQGTSSNPLGGFNIDSVQPSTVLSVLAEPFSSSVVFPCKQYLTDKADSVFVYITVPNGQVVASNGLLKRKVVEPGNKITYQWESRYPIAYYLIAFGISDYKEYSYKFYDENYGDSIFFQNFVYSSPTFLNSVKSEIDMTVDVIKYYEQVTNVAFPFRKEKYGHVTAPIGGGMENQTMTMLSSFNTDLVSHELAHSWFGDLVTCSSWQDIWINEGFATYHGISGNIAL